MLKISQQQAAALRSSALDDFVVRLIAYCERVFPERCAELGEPGLRGLVMAGLAKANGYGLTSERDICKYINLMFLAGVDFDTEAPWAPVFRKAGKPDVFERALDETYAEWLEK